ncbi:MAG: amidohydrolase family protein [Acetobacteraceae bacterium]
MADETNHYGATAARPQGPSGREARPRSITIDMHSHVLVPEAAELVAPHVDLSTVPLAHFATPGTKALNQKQDRDRRANMLDLDVRLADLDAAGIDLQVIMPPPPQCTYTIPLDLAVKAGRIVNKGLADFAAKKPERFTALGTVPMQDGETAAAELERGMKEHGLKGVQVLTNVAGNELSDPAYAPFWAKAEELGAVVLIHPNGFTEGRRMTRFYFNNVFGNPLETALALHYLIFDGVLERHPKLKLIAAHGGGYLPAYSGRIDHAWGARSDVRGSLPQPPTTYLKRVYFDSVVFTPHQLRYVIEVFGAGQILMGSDYPYDMAESDPVGHLASAGLDAATFAAVAGGNARALFGV